MATKACKRILAVSCEIAPYSEKEIAEAVGKEKLTRGGMLPRNDLGSRRFLRGLRSLSKGMPRTWTNPERAKPGTK